MKQSKQSGFTIVEVLLVLIFLAIVGFTGYYVWHAQKNTDKALSQTGNSEVADTATKSSSDASKSAASSQEYLTIKEWGVRLKVSTSTDSLYYYIEPGRPDVVYLSFRTVAAVAPNCAANKTSLGAIGRLAEAEQAVAVKAPTDTNTPGTIHAGSYWYGYSHAQADCTDGTDAMRAAVAKAQPDGDVYSIFKTLTLVPNN